jgi:hypothetical protein
MFPNRVIASTAASASGYGKMSDTAVSIRHASVSPVAVSTAATAAVETASARSRGLTRSSDAAARSSLSSVPSRRHNSSSTIMSG